MTIENEDTKKYKQITFDDRVLIQIGIERGDSFKKIGQRIHKSTSTITHEIITNRTRFNPLHDSVNDCIHYSHCQQLHLCGDKTCNFPCRWCRRRSIVGPCYNKCSLYISYRCSFLTTPPYVCNCCQQKNLCQKEKYIYNAKEADSMAFQRKSSSHKGPHVDDKQIAKINRVLSKLVQGKGQSISHIMATHADVIKVSERTLYRYINKSYLTIRNIDLLKLVTRKPRSRPKIKVDKNKDMKRKDRSYKIGRTYADFNDYVMFKTDKLVCEMDTVLGRQLDAKRLLTILFRRNSILLIFLIPNGKAASVCNIFNMLEAKLGMEVFKRLFPVILTDNGSEFQQVEGIELNSAKEYRTNLYFCDPMCSWQKGAIEKAHEFIRYVLPKGESFEPYDQSAFTLLMNHINSYKRKGLENKCPYDLINEQDEDMHKLMNVLHMKQIKPDEVNLTPSLLKKFK